MENSVVAPAPVAVPVPVAVPDVAAIAPAPTPSPAPAPAPEGAYLGDGYSLTHNIPACSFHQELNLEFRPATSTEAAVIRRKIRRLDDRDQMEEIEKEAAKFMASKILSWDLSSKGKFIPVAEGSILQLEQHLSRKLWDVIIGDEPAVAKKVEADVKN